MALDPGGGVIAIVFRNPPTLVLLDRESGAERAHATTLRGEGRWTAPVLLAGGHVAVGEGSSVRVFRRDLNS